MLDKTYVYEYNNSRWGDQLTGIAINGDSQSFTYNSIGLPTVYRGKNLTWNQRNLLGRFDGNTFTYDATGMRLTKNGITYEYFGNNLIKETRGTDVIEYVDGTSGKLGFVYNNVPYYYIRNVLGDVKGILDANGNLVAEYKYDAWGKCTIASQTGLHLGTKNPIRYRGYFYDEETKLYYLQSRYYDPDIGRFISPDNTKYLDPESLGGLNLYAYCNNNPVMYSDPSGHVITAALIGWLIGGIVVGGAIGGTLGGITASNNNGNVAAGIITGALLGAAVGGIIGYSIATNTTVLLIDDMLSVAESLFSDTIYTCLSGHNQFGGLDDYAITFISSYFGNINYKKSKEFKKYLMQNIVSPIASQFVNTTMHGKSINYDFWDEMGYNLTNSIFTSFVNYKTFKIFGKDFNWSKTLLSGFLNTWKEEYGPW